VEIDPMTPLHPRTLARSREWLERSARRIPGCAQTFSKGPISFVQNVAPNFLVRGKGPWVWDVDGNRYVDYILGLGPVILGHADPAVNDAAARQMALGVSFSLPHTVEVEVAELLCDLIPCAEMVRFGKNGSDATAAAVRVARAFTGRDLVVRCGYHGWQDWFIGSTSRYLGVPAAVRALTLRFPYNDPGALERIFAERPGQVACVILEAVVLEPPAPGFLEGLREQCRRHGALLIFDEIVTGFRMAFGGAQEYFKVLPDLACFGKAMANGFPLSAVVGRAAVMRLFEDVFFSGTHGGEAVSLAACQATIAELRRRDGFAALWRTGARLQDGARRILSDLGIAHRVDCPGLPPRTGFSFRADTEAETLALRSLFQQEALKRGILTHGNHMISLAHTDEVVDLTLEIYREVFAAVADALAHGDAERRLEGPPVKVVVRDL
jgi:glutamate-1-semialdehyde-2,1-aminomutase